jgi:outer membrane protein assembly factor BamB
MMCFDEKDGSFCWQLVVPKLGKDPFIDWPRVGMCSSPTIDGDRAYILSNKGEVICLDLNGMANGNDGPYRDEGRHMAPKDVDPMEPSEIDADIIWLYDLIAEQGVHVHDGAHSSILVHGNFLYVNTSNGLNSKHTGVHSPDAPSLVVIDKTTGKFVARENEKISQKIFHCTWSSPALGHVNGRPLVFFGGGDGICYAFEAVQSDKPIDKYLKNVWKFDCDPTAPKENIHQYIRNRKESPSNIKSTPVFYKNRIYVTVGGDIWWGKHQAWLKCIDATKTGDVTDSAQIWSYPLNQHCCSTPSIYNGLVFIADCGQRVHAIHCVDAETGKPYWTHETKGDMWASTLVADGKVYIGTRRGQFLVMAASKEKKIISEIELDSPTNSTPVAANGVLYVTTMKKLYALEKSSE